MHQAAAAIAPAAGVDRGLHLDVGFEEWDKFDHTVLLEGIRA